MNCNDDIPGDQTSTTDLTLGQRFTSTLVHEGCESDVDYLRVDLEYGKRYLLEGNRSSSSIFSRSFIVQPRLFDDFASYGPGGSGFSPTSNTFRAIHGGTHFFRITDLFPENTYSLTLTEISSDDQVREDEFPLGYAAFDSLTTDSRTVPFRFETNPGKEYVLNVFGVDGGGIGTLADPWLGVGDSIGNEFFDQDGGIGRNPNIRFTAQSDVAFATVGGVGNGSFRLNIREVDTVPTLSLIHI